MHIKKQAKLRRLSLLSVIVTLSLIARGRIPSSSLSPDDPEQLASPLEKSASAIASPAFTSIPDHWVSQHVMRIGGIPIETYAHASDIVARVQISHVTSARFNSPDGSAPGRPEDYDPDHGMPDDDAPEEEWAAWESDSYDAFQIYQLVTLTVDSVLKGDAAIRHIVMIQTGGEITEAFEGESYTYRLDTESTPLTERAQGIAFGTTVDPEDPWIQNSADPKMQACIDEARRLASTLGPAVCAYVSPFFLEDEWGSLSSDNGDEATYSSLATSVAAAVATHPTASESPADRDQTGAWPYSTETPTPSSLDD